jgi:phosphoribosylglycinamide formyltransferase-1
VPKQPPAIDILRERVIHLALALPEAEAHQGGPLGEHSSFRVRGKAFAYYVVNEHNDGRVALLWKAAPGRQAALVGAEPARFFVPKYIGPRGWVGLDLDAGEIDWREIDDSLRESYLLVAPKRLAAVVGG